MCCLWMRTLDQINRVIFGTISANELEVFIQARFAMALK